MEKQENLTFMELLLRILNNCLLHFKLCMVIVTIPTIIMFVMVMWVLEPTYRAEAIVTPPSSETSIAGSLGKFVDGLDNLGSFSSLLGKTDNGTDIVWTYLNSWELHDMVIEKFDLVNHYEFDGKFHADLLKQFRKNFEVEINDEGMFKLTFEDEDYVLAADVLNFMLAKADSMYNYYKTSQAKISKQYIEERLEREERAIDSLQEVFVKFQTDNQFYDPEIQLEATMKYLSSLQGSRDMVAQELAFEKMERGESGRRYEELRKRLNSVDASMKQATQGKRSSVGIVALDKSSDLAAQYLRIESEVKIKMAVYKYLRQQSEQLALVEANMRANLIVLQPAWPNDKKVFPIRSMMLAFTCLVAGLIAVFVSCFIERCKTSDKNSVFTREMQRLAGFFRKKKVA